MERPAENPLVLNLQIQDKHQEIIEQIKTIQRLNDESRGIPQELLGDEHESRPKVRGDLTMPCSGGPDPVRIEYRNGVDPRYKDDAERYKDEVDRLTKLLCTAGRAYINGGVPEELQTWWDRHAELDGIRGLPWDHSPVGPVKPVPRASRNQMRHLIALHQQIECLQEPLDVLTQELDEMPQLREAAHYLADAGHTLAKANQRLLAHYRTGGSRGPLPTRPQSGT